MYFFHYFQILFLQYLRKVDVIKEIVFSESLVRFCIASKTFGSRNWGFQKRKKRIPGNLEEGYFCPLILHLSRRLNLTLVKWRIVLKIIQSKGDDRNFSLWLSLWPCSPFEMIKFMFIFKSIEAFKTKKNQHSLYNSLLFHRTVALFLEWDIFGCAIRTSQKFFWFVISILNGQICKMQLLKHLVVS